MGSLYVDSWTVTIDNCYDQVSDPVSNQYVGTALARSEQLVIEQWLQGEEGGHIPMPGQGRLAISRLRVPNLDAFIDATAGNLFSIGTPRHRVDPVIVIVRTRIIRNEEEKTNKKLTNPSARSASSCKPYILHFYIFSMYLSEKVTISSGLSHGHSQEHDFVIFLFFCF